MHSADNVLSASGLPSTLFHGSPVLEDILKVSLPLRLGIFPMQAYTNMYRSTQNNSTVFWLVSPCCSEKFRCFGGTYRLHLQDRKKPAEAGAKQRPRFGLASFMFSITLWLPMFLSLLASYLAEFSTLKMKAICPAEKSGFL
jgi:hypothetical protein